MPEGVNLLLKFIGEELGREDEETFSLTDKVPGQVYKQIKKSAEGHKATFDTWENNLRRASTFNR